MRWQESQEVEDGNTEVIYILILIAIGNNY